MDRVGDGVLETFERSDLIGPCWHPEHVPACHHPTCFLEGGMQVGHTPRKTLLQNPCGCAQGCGPLTWCQPSCGVDKGDGPAHTGSRYW
jgi:hypothetical protein